MDRLVGVFGRRRHLRRCFRRGFSRRLRRRLLRRAAHLGARRRRQGKQEGGDSGEQQGGEAGAGPPRPFGVDLAAPLQHAAEGQLDVPAFERGAPLQVEQEAAADVEGLEQAGAEVVAEVGDEAGGDRPGVGVFEIEAVEAGVAARQQQVEEEDEGEEEGDLGHPAAVGQAAAGEVLVADQPAPLLRRALLDAPSSRVIGMVSERCGESRRQVRSLKRPGPSARHERPRASAAPRRRGRATGRRAAAARRRA